MWAQAEEGAEDPIQPAIVLTCRSRAAVGVQQQLASGSLSWMLLNRGRRHQLLLPHPATMLVVGDVPLTCSTLVHVCVHTRKKSFALINHSFTKKQLQKKRDAVKYILLNRTD